MVKLTSSFHGVKSTPCIEEAKDFTRHTHGVDVRRNDNNNNNDN